LRGVDLNHRSRFAGLCAAEARWVQAGLSEESSSAFLRFQFQFTASCCCVIWVRFCEDELPWTISLCPASQVRGIMLLQAMRRVFADSNRETPACAAPQHVNEVRLVGNSRHTKKGGRCGTAFRMVAGGGFELQARIDSTYLIDFSTSENAQNGDKGKSIIQFSFSLSPTNES
jgi:hypothetical protein